MSTICISRKIFFYNTKKHNNEVDIDIYVQISSDKNWILLEEA